MWWLRREWCVVLVAAAFLGGGCRWIAGHRTAASIDGAAADGGARDGTIEGGIPCGDDTALPQINAFRLLLGLDAEPTAPIVVATGQPLYVLWNVTDVGGLASPAVQLFTTTDDIGYAPRAVVGQDVKRCQRVGPMTGCAKINAPSGGYFRVRLVATDCSGQIVARLSAPVNAPGFTQLAGDTDDGRGTSARQAIYAPDLSDHKVADAGSLIVLDREVKRANGAALAKGTIFLRDRLRGLLVVDPSRRLLETLIPLDPAGDKGAIPADVVEVGSATLRRPVKIALDSSGGLLIFDQDRIRRLNLETGRIRTVVGGGNHTGDTAPARDVKIVPPKPSTAQATRQIPFFVTPKGELYFQSENYLARPNDSSAPFRIRIYDGTNVRSLRISDTKKRGDSFSNKNGFPQDAGACRVQSFGLTWDTAGNISRRQATTLHDPNDAQCGGGWGGGLIDLDDTGTVVDSSGYTLDSDTMMRVVGRDGRLYGVDRDRGQLFMLIGKSGAPVWQLLAGAGRNNVDAVKPCGDGVDLTTCAIDPIDLYVGSEGTLYLVESGRVRRLIKATATYVAETIVGQDYAPAGAQERGRARFSDNLGDIAKGFGPDEYVVLDAGRRRLLRIGPKDVITLAGNGSHNAPVNNTPATAQGILTRRWGARAFTVACDPKSSRCFYGRGPRRPLQSEAKTVFTIAGVGQTSVGQTGGGQAGDSWVDVVGTLDANAKPYYQADGMKGTNLLLPHGSLPAVLGLAKNWLLVGASTQDNAERRLVAYDTQDGFQQVTVAGLDPSKICGTNTNSYAISVPGCTVGSANALTHAAYDETGQRWLVGKIARRGIDALPFDANTGVANGKTQRFPTDKTLRGFTFARIGQGSEQKAMVFYCDTSGALRLREIDNAAGVPEQPIRLPGRLRCTGRGMRYDPALQALVFLFTHLGKGGVGQVANLPLQP